MPTYKWEKGEFEWKESAKPVYKWYNGYMQRKLFGDKVDKEKETINITKPFGDKKDPDSKISPFKAMRGVQGMDAKHDYLLVPHLFTKNENDNFAYCGKDLIGISLFKQG